MNGWKQSFRYFNGSIAEFNCTVTHFNVNAYEDEKDVITTLAEGQVLVGREGKQAVLGPDSKCSEHFQFQG